MNERRITVGGESFVTLETAAACFHVEASWVREVYESGLLGPAERVGDELAIATALLDRLATIQRLHWHWGLDLAAIELVIDDLSRVRGEPLKPA